VPVSLTGNPFVDTGLAVVAALANLGTVEDLTYKHLRETYGDGSRLSSWNSHLRSFSLVFGTNNPLLQTSYGYEKGNGPSELNHRIYRSTLRNFLAAMVNESGPLLRCEACGILTRFDFAAACGAATEENGHKAVKEKWLGRNWFPLAGSMGSDAQALPAASRTVRLCGKCLFAVHYLPLGVMLLDGRLAVFQSTYTALWYELIRRVVNIMESRLPAGEYKTLGGKEGSRGLSALLLEGIERLQKTGQVSALPSATVVSVWSFVNSSPPECGLEEISNPVLDFLWEAVRHGLHDEIDSLLKNVKKEDTTFLDSIAQRQDYWGIYPHNRWKGASTKLFAFYQIRVCKRVSRTLALARALASQYAIEIRERDPERLKGEAPFSEASLRDHFRELMIRFALDGKLRLTDYLDLFPLVQTDSGIEVCPDGWNILRYYLHHVADCEPLQDQATLSRPMLPELEAVRYYAAHIMQGYIKQSGKKRLLNRINRSEASLRWLKRQFACLAESDSGFTYEAWKRLAIDESGRLCAGEVVFQMRLLWSEWMREGIIPQIQTPTLPNGTGLPNKVARMLTWLYFRYTQKRGRAQFQEDVLIPLRQMEIGLEWFHHRFIDLGKELAEANFSLDTQWESFLRDEEGRLRSGERLFQMRLMLANLYRESGKLGNAKIA
jgi:hypothetical protein